MSVKVDLAAVTEQVQKQWAPMFTKRLRGAQLLPGLVNKDYKGAIKKGGDTVKVSQIVDINGQLLTVGTDADSFDSEPLTMLDIDIVADKRAVASLEFEDLVDLQSQLDGTKVQDTMMFAILKQMNTYLYSLVAPSTSAPDHEIASVTDFNSAQLGACKVLADTAQWSEDGGWFALLGPQYHQDLLTSTSMVSSDFVASDAPTINGKTASKRYGFNVYLDNSRTGDYGLLFHPDFMHLVQQTEVQVKMSDLHSQKKFGYLMSVDLVFGAKLGHQGSIKHIRVQN